MNSASGSNTIDMCPRRSERAARYFTEVLICETCVIPEGKPDKQSILHVRPTVELVHVETIPVILPTESEVAGSKIFAAGRIWADVQYISTKPEQSVHFLRCQLPFEAIILQDCGQLIPERDPIFSPKAGYVVRTKIEKFTETEVDPRTIRFEALLLVAVELVPPRS